MKNLTRKQLDSVTPEQIKNTKKISAILANMDILNEDPQWLSLMREGLAAREFGLSFKRIEALLNERAVL